MSHHADLLDRFRHSPAVFAAAIEGVTTEESQFSPAPGKWSVREIARHLADTEIVAGMRLRQIVAEDRPTLAMFDQDKWAANLNYNDCDPTLSLRDFLVLREINADMLAGVPAEAFDREGLHATRGVTTLRFWVDMFSKHVDLHAQQIRHVRAVWSQKT